MSLPGRARVTINPLQWATPRIDPTDPHSPRAWLVADPTYADRYPAIFADVKRAGFDSVMLSVHPSQTLQSFARMLRDAGLLPAPGYASVDVPDVLPARGTASYDELYGGVRRAAEESAYFGLETIFLAPAMTFTPESTRTVRAAAVGADRDPARLDRMTAVLAEATEVLAAEGVRAGLHNHIGTWVETVDEIDHVLAAIPNLGASFDIGHLAWLGVDPAPIVARYADRIIDLHVKDLDLELAAASRAEPLPYSWAPARGLFAEPGDGDLDLDGVLAALPDGFDGWIEIEVDSTTIDPFESVARCAAWADRTFGA